MELSDKIKKETGFFKFVEFVLLSVVSLGLYLGWWEWSRRQRQTLILNEILNQLEEMNQNERSQEDHLSRD